MKSQFVRATKGLGDATDCSLDNTSPASIGLARSDSLAVIPRICCAAVHVHARDVEYACLMALAVAWHASACPLRKSTAKPFHMSD
jgi:hypothetical protein